MATYQELADLERDQTLLDKMKAACWIAADAIKDELVSVPNHTNRLIWATEVYKKPDLWAQRMLRNVLAVNEAVSRANILVAADTAWQTNANAAVDLFADGSTD